VGPATDPEAGKDVELYAQTAAALDGANVCVMLSDKDLRITYFNRSLERLFRSAEADFKALFGPSFSANNLVGKCVDGFHKNPTRTRGLIGAGATFPYKTEIRVGSLTIELSVTALRDAAGEITGYCTEWADMTARLAAEQEYRAAVKTIADRIDMLRGACATDLARAMEGLVVGDLTIELTPKTPLLDIPAQSDLALMAESFNGLRDQTVKSVEAYNRARQSLAGLVANTKVASDSIVQASSEITTGTDDLARRTEEQASSLEETSASMEQMTSTVKQNADNAREANQLAAQAREVAEKGGAVVGKAVRSMEEINTASKRIADIISVIDEIAFQTNLLALNAAVEAARVGEQGRGFAVVAAEVRNLAGRSATAAKEIKALVQDSVQKVQEGNGQVNQSGQTLEEIVLAVKKVADIISEISAASQEQSSGIEQVNKAVMQMDQITQQNAALVEETAAASQSMTDQAAGLQGLVNRFKLDSSVLEAALAASEAASSATVTARPASMRRPTRSSIQAQPRRAARPTVSDGDGFEEF
jgi:methyl-accepting chemotaxis protein